MMLTVLAVVLGLTVGLLTGGRWQRLTGVAVHRVGLALAGFAIPLATMWLDPPAAPLWVAIGLLCVIAFAASNLHLVGMGVVIVGVSCNLLVIAVNGHFPVDPDAVVAAGLSTEADVHTVSFTGGRQLVDSGARLGFLGDIIPVRATGQVLSFGDLIILVGLMDVAAHLVMRRRRRRVQAAGSAAVLRSINSTSPAHDWGTAPRPTPVSAFQYSASVDATAPATVDDANRSAVPSRS